MLNFNPLLFLFFIVEDDTMQATIKFTADQKSITIYDDDLDFLYFEDKTSKVESFEALENAPTKIFFYRWTDDKLYKCTITSINGK